LAKSVGRKIKGKPLGNVYYKKQELDDKAHPEKAGKESINQT
jgi:hypothetical protein